MQHWKGPHAVCRTTWRVTIIARLKKVKRKLTFSRKYRVVFVFLATILITTVVNLLYYQWLETHTKGHPFTKRSNKEGEVAERRHWKKLQFESPYNVPKCVSKPKYCGLKCNNLVTNVLLKCTWNLLNLKYPFFCEIKNQEKMRKTNSSDLTYSGSSISKESINTLAILNSSSLHEHSRSGYLSIETPSRTSLLTHKNQRSNAKGEGTIQKRPKQLLEAINFGLVKNNNIYQEEWKLTQIPKNHSLFFNMDLKIKKIGVRDTGKHLAQSKRENLMEVKKRGCEPLYPQVVLYNRIFKTGSTTMSSFLKHCSKKMNFDFKLDQIEERSNETISRPISKHIQKVAKRSKKRNKQLFFVEHFYFRRNIRIPMNYTYVNLLRDPVNRFISHYYYARSPYRWPERLNKLKELGHLNESIEECLEKQHEGCTWNLMTRFFCGTQVICGTGSGKALELAKYNLEHYYASVGVLENLQEFVRVLHKRIPGFVMDYKGTLKKKFSTKGVYKQPVSNSVMTKIINVNRVDIELYKFAKKLFKRQAEQCGIKLKE